MAADEHGPDIPGGFPERMVETAKRHGVDLTVGEVREAMKPGRGLIGEALKPGNDLGAERLLDAVALQRRYLPTLAELIDRLSIVQLKQIFISEHADAYGVERADIMHDIDILLAGQRPMDAAMIHAVMMIMLTNRVIWEFRKPSQGGT